MQVRAILLENPWICHDCEQQSNTSCDTPFFTGRDRCPSFVYLRALCGSGFGSLHPSNRHEKTCAKINRRFFPQERRLCCAASAVQVFRMVLNPVPRAERLSLQPPMTPPSL